MIAKIRILLILMFLIPPLAIVAQEDFGNNKLDGSMLITKEFLIANNILNTESQQMVNQYIQNDNLVQIKQIGNFNSANVDVRSYETNVEVNQYGDNNFTNVYRNAYILEENITQSGNNNFLSDFSVYSDEPVNTSFNQYGNNLSIISTGSNSISKNLQINQYGNSGTVYIYNR